MYDAIFFVYVQVVHVILGKFHFTISRNSKLLEYKISDESVLINSGARADLTVKFEKSYVSPPTIIATPYTSTGGGVDIAVKNITNTGFTANMKNGGASAAYFKVCYVALNTTPSPV